ncbi:MAG: AMP-binding protein [Gaiellales bacterium]
MSDHLWIPDAATIDAAQSTALARHLGLDTYEDLLAFSVTDPAAFWDAATRWLDLGWETEWTDVVDATRGVAWAEWFVGGRLNLAWSCVGRHVATRGDHPAIVVEHEDLSESTRTFAELWDEVGRLGQALREMGVAEGDRIAIVLPMGVEAVAAIYAAARIGAIAVPIFSGFSATAIAARFEDCAVKAVIASDTTTRRGRPVPVRATVEAALELAPVEHVIIVGGDGHAHHDYAALSDRADGADCPTLWLDSETPAFICYTSGTTGKPKGAVHTHAGLLVKLALEGRLVADLRPDDRAMWFTDMGWIMGPWITIGTHASGVTMVCLDGAPDYPDPGRLWQLAERQRLTFLGVSPTLIRVLQGHGDELPHAADLSALRLFGSTGEPWNPEPYEWLFNVVGDGKRPIMNISGGTEIGAVIIGCDVTLPLSSCSLGRPLPGMDVDVLDPTGGSLTDEVGELVIRAPFPSMTRGLWHAPDRYIETYWNRYPDTWTHGDWATRTTEGSWFLHGRSDDTINIAGKRIGPAEYESALVADPDVREACTVGLPHPVKGEAVHCLVVLRDGVVLDDDLQLRLRQAVERELGPAFRPERILQVTELPKTRSQKVVRRAVRAVLLGEDPGDLSTLENPSALEALGSVS